MNGHDIDIGDDLKITKVASRGTGAAGTWVTGSVAGHDFSALVFAEHADNPDWELGDSRIAKLWVRRSANRRTVFNWDRGEDMPAADEEAGRIVGFLCAGLADHVFAG